MSRTFRLPGWVLPMLPGVLLYCAAYVPSLILLGVLSIQTFVPGELYARPLTLDSYFLFLQDPYYREIAATTVYMSGGAGILTVFIAFPLAYVLVRSPGLRRVILPVVALSFFVSALVLLYGLLGILSRGGPLVGPINELGSRLGLISEPISVLYTPTAVVIGLVDFGIPYAVLVLIGSINSLDEALEQAAQDLGATQWQTFLRVTLPLSFPGILAALVLTFSLNVSSVLTPLILGSSKVQTLSTQVYNSMLLGLNYPFASAAIVIMLLAVFVLTSVTGRALRTRVVR